MVDKIDLKKIYKNVYAAKPEPAFVDVPALSAYTLEGIGSPDSEAFGSAVAAVYAAAYALKFLKKPGGFDWTVSCLEADWWADDLDDFAKGRRDRWRWRVIIVQPEAIDRKAAADGIKTAKDKKGLEQLSQIEFVTLKAHRAAHILHRGPFATEAATIQRLHEFIGAQGLAPRDHHREIYLSDMRRTSPEKLKTIIRQPVG